MLSLGRIVSFLRRRSDLINVLGQRNKRRAVSPPHRHEDRGLGGRRGSGEARRKMRQVFLRLRVGIDPDAREGNLVVPPLDPNKELRHGIGLIVVAGMRELQHF